MARAAHGVTPCAALAVCLEDRVPRRALLPVRSRGRDDSAETGRAESSLLDERHLDARLHDPLERLTHVLDSGVVITRDDLVRLDTRRAAGRRVTDLLDVEQELQRVGRLRGVVLEQVAEA